MIYTRGWLIAWTKHWAIRPIRHDSFRVGWRFFEPRLIIGRFIIAKEF